ncbi:MAG: copper chaperone [Rhodospirillales bacterium]|nr:MAG: copper chaperone [Rhodospirillales bacterium]
MAKTYRVEGMTCQGCVRAVGNAIRERVPDAAVDVDLEAGTVRVGDGTDEAAIRDAVAGAGFRFLGSAG